MHTKEKTNFETGIGFRPEGQMQQVGLDVLCKYIREMWWVGGAIKIQMAKEQFQPSFNSA